MLYGCSREEIKKIVGRTLEGKTFEEAIDELYPESEMQCIFDCALEYQKSFSIIEAIYNGIIKNKQPIAKPSCARCFA